ncbi:response regulator [Pseudomonas stutzeri]|uniref:response regulator n=1 Tax=Stutzerimonas frequens TaxID=2968969 RepID=UPI0019093308|nr:response regulator [Stutzerimonas frequens]MBK3916287.1 response regulator [Stutzerimonas frequens]
MSNSSDANTYSPLAPAKAISKILIVDDSKTDTYVARKVAEELFDEVRSVSNVDEMFKELQTFRPDILTMDIHLSDRLNGISLVAEIRALDNDLSVMPIVVISSRQMPSDKQIASNAGASDYIIKPVTVEALERTARRLIPGFVPKTKPFGDMVTIGDTK